MNKEKNKQKYELYDAKVVNKLSDLMSSSDRLGNIAYMNGVAAGLSLMGAISCGLGHVALSPSTQSDLLVSSAALGVVGAVALANRFMINKKRDVINKEISNIKEIRRNDYLNRMQLITDLNYDNYYAAKLETEQELEIEF